MGHSMVRPKTKDVIQLRSSHWYRFAASWKINSSRAEYVGTKVELYGQMEVYPLRNSGEGKTLDISGPSFEDD